MAYKRSKSYYKLNSRLGDACRDASAKQISYLASLISKHGDEFADEWSAACKGQVKIERSAVSDLICAFKAGETCQPADFVVAMADEEMPLNQPVTPAHLFAWFQESDDVYGDLAPNLFGCSDKMLWAAAYRLHPHIAELTVGDAMLEWRFDEDGQVRKWTKSEIKSIFDAF